MQSLNEPGDLWYPFATSITSTRATELSMSNALQVPWPELPLAAWRETYETLHLWTQIIGKIRLAISLAESFLACCPVRYCARIDDLSNPQRR